MADPWELLALLAFGLCPASALVGLFVGVWGLRALGVQWPWERAESPRLGTPRITPNRPRVGDTFVLSREPAGRVGMRVAELQRMGWHLVYQDKVNSTNLYDLRFIWLGEEQ